MADEPQHVDQEVAEPDIELLLAQAEPAIASIDRPLGGAPPEVRPFQLAEFTGARPNTEHAKPGSPGDVDLDLAIEFGRTQMDLEDALGLRAGSVVPLDKLTADPVDIVVNGRLIAHGEVLVLNDNFCVRVAELIADERGG